jgi:hypothetical protein
MLDDVSGQGHKSQKGHMATRQSLLYCIGDRVHAAREESFRCLAAATLFSRLLSGLNPPSPRPL